MSRSRLSRVVPAFVIGVAAVGTLSFRPADARMMEDPPPYCWHDRFVISSEWHCGDTSAASPSPSPTNYFVPVGNFPAGKFADRDSLFIITAGSDTTRVALHPGVDAVFLSRFAVDTFLAPYFEDSGDAATATRIRNHVRTHWPTRRAERMMLVCERIVGGDQKWYCPDSAHTTRINPSTVKKVLFIRHIGSDRFALNPGRGVDAIFLSKDASEHCLLQYYEKKVTTLRASIASKRWR